MNKILDLCVTFDIFQQWPMPVSFSFGTVDEILQVSSVSSIADEKVLSFEDEANSPAKKDKENKVIVWFCFYNMVTLLLISLKFQDQVTASTVEFKPVSVFTASPIVENEEIKVIIFYSNTFKNLKS